jgi:hypothetical protein
MGDTLPAKRGRPSSYSDELATTICDRLTQGEALIAITSDAGMPSIRSVFRWLEANDRFRREYARARELQAHVMAEKAVAAGDAATPEDAHAARVRYDAMRWYAGKLLPKTYGDKVQQEHSGTVTLEALVGGSFQKSVERDANAIIEHDPKDGE